MRCRDFPAVKFAAGLANLNSSDKLHPVKNEIKRELKFSIEPCVEASGADGQ